MLESLRAIGYAFEAAVADIVDNSVAALATTVDVQFRPQPRPYVAVIDNGTGMTADDLVEAMRHGGRGPRAGRDERDLGRFGLGLKTASLSQCRRLTVATAKDRVMSAATWNLDRIEETGDWTLGLLSEEELANIPHITEIAEIGHGTIVLWEHFDRATAGELNPGEALGRHVDLAGDHLSLVFHRYLSGQGIGGRLEIRMNNKVLIPADPFLRSHAGTQTLPMEKLDVEGSEIVLRPFVLPHRSKMSRSDLDLAGGEDGLRRNQGFYVYRNLRLITYGTWFRLLRQEELTKLARVQVDIPNTLDHLWALDVKKSRAYPPEAVRAALVRVIERIAGTSRHVYKFRGRRAQDAITHVWERLVIRDGVSYHVNRQHPLVGHVFDLLDDLGDVHLEQLLRAVEMALPTDALYADLASERRVQTDPEQDETEAFLSDVALRMMQALSSDYPAGQRLLDKLGQIEPFSSHPAATLRIIERLRSGS